MRRRNRPNQHPCEIRRFLNRTRIIERPIEFYKVAIEMHFGDGSTTHRSAWIVKGETEAQAIANATVRAKAELQRQLHGLLPEVYKVDAWMQLQQPTGRVSYHRVPNIRAQHQAAARRRRRRRRRRISR